MNIRYMMNIQYLVNVVKDATHFECSIRFEHSILDERDRLFYFFGGVLSQHGTAVYAQACAQAVPRLVAMIGAVDARSVENINPTENAISAVTKILKFNASQVNVDEILPVWLSWLPVYEDVDESPYVYGYLCDLVEANHPAVLGANNANLPKVIQIMADALMMDAMPMGHEVKTRVINLCKQVQVIQVQ